jgi:hypothetical protein
LKHVYENELEKQEIQILKKKLAAHKETIKQKIKENIKKEIKKIEGKSIQESPSDLIIMDYDFLPDFVDTSFCYVDLLEKPGTENKVDISVYKKDKNIKQKLHQTDFAEQDEICSLLIKSCNVGSV